MKMREAIEIILTRNGKSKDQIAQVYLDIKTKGEVDLEADIAPAEMIKLSQGITAMITMLDSIPPELRGEVVDEIFNK